MKSKTAAVLLVFATVAAGCKTADSRRGEHPAAAPVRDGVDRFLTLSMTGEYGKISELVIPSRASGFNGRVFVENRFRMPVNRFEILAWDRTLIKVIELREGPGLLSSVPVSVRHLATNEVKPVYVNLQWQRALGRWLIEPYPPE